MDQAVEALVPVKGDDSPDEVLTSQSKSCTKEILSVKIIFCQQGQILTSLITVTASYK